MPDLLLELFSEEIPARMQRQAADDLRRLVTGALVEAGLTYEGARAFVTPRRLALTVHGLTARSTDVAEEKKGPRVGAPEKAIEGFLRGAGLSSIDQAKIEKDPKKGDFYVARVTKPGRAAEEIVAEIVPATIRTFPWPKSMRWGARSAPADSSFAGRDAEGTASLRWVRPLRSILCTLGPETEEPIVVAFDVAGIAAGNETYGHRFMHGGKPIAVRRYDDYQPKLEAAKVVLDHDRRQAIIETEAKNLAFAQGLEIVEDKGLLEEVAGLVEWPVVLMGTFDKDFLAIPEEVIRLTIRQNQKCFVLRRAVHPGVPPTSLATGEGDHAQHGGGGSQERRDRHSPPPPRSAVPLPRSAGEEPAPLGQLTNRFILVANIEASDGGKEIVAGNERVIAARLSDARFFWEQDLKHPLEEHAKKLGTITFHEKLGSQADRVKRISALARELASIVGADPDAAGRAAELCKADLPTGMVGEFPELQGVMGRYYARAHGEAPAVAEAVRDHYRPQGPNDSVPKEPVSIAVALADKLDTLFGFWAIDEKPTGSKDPYALRRAALGVIRIILENGLRIRLAALRFPSDPSWTDHNQGDPGITILEALLYFITDRLEVYLRDTGARHDLIGAVFALSGQDDLLMIVRRVEALGNFLDTDDGRNLLVGYRRAANILRAEEKKDGEGAFDAPPDEKLIETKGQPEERAFYAAMQTAERHARANVEREDFEGAMKALAELRPAVDAFFDKVTVNADDPELRRNRLKLLNMLRRSTLSVADFSKIGG